MWPCSSAPGSSPSAAGAASSSCAPTSPPCRRPTVSSRPSRRPTSSSAAAPGREKLHFLNPVPVRLIHDRWITKYTEQRVSEVARHQHSRRRCSVTLAEFSRGAQQRVLGVDPQHLAGSDVLSGVAPKVCSSGGEAPANPGQDRPGMGLLKGTHGRQSDRCRLPGCVDVVDGQPGPVSYTHL